MGRAFVALSLSLALSLALARSLSLALTLALSRALARALSLALALSLCRATAAFARGEERPVAHPNTYPSQGRLLFFFTLVTGPRRSLSLKLSDTRVHEPQIRVQAFKLPGTSVAVIKGRTDIPSAGREIDNRLRVLFATRPHTVGYTRGI